MSWFHDGEVLRGVDCIDCLWCFWSEKKHTLWCEKFNKKAEGKTGFGVSFSCTLYEPDVVTRQANASYCALVKKVGDDE